MGKKNKNDWMYPQVIDNGEVEIIEEFLELPEEKILAEAGNKLIRFDMNMIEYPLFSKNRKRKPNQVVIYYFNQRKDKYIEVRPTSGDSIPGELEERIFIALTKIMRDKKYGIEFIVSASEILDNLNVENRGTRQTLLKQIKGSIARLSQTSYTFKNTLYSNTEGSIVEDTILTNIMNVRIITKTKAKGGETEYFRDGRISEIYKISLSQPFYNNIVRKGYLVYNSELLLEMGSPITRAIYLLINKWRFNRLHIKEKLEVLIKRIPLSFDKKVISRSASIIEKSCKDLKEKGLIENFNIIKEGTWETAEIEFFFNEEHNLIKQDNFFQDRNQFNNLMISFTEEKNIEENSEKLEETERVLDEIFSLLPEKAKTLKTMPKTIMDMIKIYGLEKVKLAANYTKQNSTLSIRTYFINSLEKDWIADFKFQEKKKQQQSLKFQMLQEEIDKEKESVEKEQQELDELKIKYRNLSEKEKKKIEQDALKDYLLEAGNESSTVKRAFTLGKLSIIAKYLDKIKYFTDLNILEIVEDKIEVVIDNKKYLSQDEIRNEIRTKSMNYSNIFFFGVEEETTLLLEVGRILFNQYDQAKIQSEDIDVIVRRAIQELKKEKK
ncbi:hypothetical protein H3N56_13170 [Cetobacterium sp. 2A]|uniref:hypothetical protein n=1 Tax=unclassified Cetobacterium TaxID=2630983 RepID=UPI00163B6A09|nr:hypothetical protein [Cetobacterium sp. 2A]MBC2857386.1 hypothetical protein [Cetobacterium sp. 2A]